MVARPRTSTTRWPVLVRTAGGHKGRPYAIRIPLIKMTRASSTFLNWQNTLNNEIRIATNDSFVLEDKRFQGEIARWDDVRWSAVQGVRPVRPRFAQDRTGSHKIAQYICLTARSGSIIGEMVVSNCARRLAGRIFCVIGDPRCQHPGRAAPPAVRPHASSTDSVVLSASADILNCWPRTATRSQLFWPKRTHWGGPQVLRTRRSCAPQDAPKPNGPKAKRSAPRSPSRSKPSHAGDISR